MALFNSAKGPWSQRLLVLVFAGLFGLLVFWLIGFILRDIGTWPGPDYAAFEESRLDSELLSQERDLDAAITRTEQQIAEQRERQQILRESTVSSQQTMNQLLEFQRLNLQQGADLTDDERQALAEAETLFLENQRQYQQLNEEVSRFSGELRDLRQQRGALEETIEEKREPIRERFESLRERHNLQIAAAKLGVLLPLVIAGVVLFLRLRRSLYAPMVQAYGIAVLVRVGLVMHEYFPARYFKYVLILVSIVVVARILVHLLHMLAHPRLDVLLKRYREAYERFNCPICDYPIRRGPLRYLLRTRRRQDPPIAPNEVASDEPYVCPSCGTRLFEECDVCHATRHALLPACEKCGAMKELADTTVGSTVEKAGQRSEPTQP